MTSTALAAPRPTALGPAWDAFQLMDRLDEQALIREMEGIAVRELVYVIKGGKDGKEDVEGLSKVGVDECARMLVRDGQVIRETDLRFELIGEGEQQQGVFTAKAARFALNPSNGQEMKLDEVIGVKRQAMYEERATLTLDSKVPGKKWKGHTFRQLLEDEEGRGYLEWMSESFKEEHMRVFARKLLDGEDVTEMATGTRFNPHWYEHGAMKACRNARIRLIPLNVRAQVIALAKQEGRAKVVDRSGEEVNGNGDGGEQGREEKVAPPAFPYSRKHNDLELKGRPLTEKLESGMYLIPETILDEALKWAEKILAGEGKKKLETDAQKASFTKLVGDLRAELARRKAEAAMTSEGQVSTAGYGGEAEPLTPEQLAAAGKVAAEAPDPMQAPPARGAREEAKATVAPTATARPSGAVPPGGKVEDAIKLPDSAPLARAKERVQEAERKSKGGEKKPVSLDDDRGKLPFDE